MWQILGDWQIGRYVKSLTKKQRQALFLSAVRLCTSEQIACYTDKTIRGVNKLIAAALEYIRSHLAERIKARLEKGLPVTNEKTRFLVWYEAQRQSDTASEQPDKTVKTAEQIDEASEELDKTAEQLDKITRQSEQEQSQQEQSEQEQSNK